MATTAQNVIDAVSQDIRKLLAASGADSSILLDYVERVHREILLRKRWRFLLSGIKSFTTTSGSTDYYIGTGGLPAGAINTTLALADIKQLVADSVFDTTNYRILYPTAEKPRDDSYWVTANYPSLFRSDVATPSVMNLYPPPNGAYVIQFRYYKSITAISALSTNLQVPDDYKFVVVAGVNRLASIYLKRDQDVAYWNSAYEMGFMTMVRDQNLGFWDYINPGI